MEQDSTREAGSFLAATVFGIPVRVHGMFSILMLVFGGIAAGIGALEIALFLPAVLIACALHELGHCLMARRLGYPVQSIVLHPFRGASPVQRPQNPRHEFSIAVAGPAMNLLMSALVGTSHLAFPQNSFLGRFLFFNLFLGLLNLVPAFPMDGGHALRAVLATQMPRENASRTAVRLSLGTAVLFVVIGLSHAGLYWALFALFIAVGTSQEMSSTTFFAAIKDMTARDAMQTDVQTLMLSQTLDGIASSGLPVSQRFFPVTCGDEIFGVLSRTRLEIGIRGGRGSSYVAEWMNRNMLFAAPDEPLKTALERSRLSPGSPILVGEPGHLLGMITLESVQNLLSGAGARQNR